MRTESRAPSLSQPNRSTIMRAMEILAGQHLPGRSRPVRLATIALLTGGHLLLEDIPGLGKTTLALAFAHTLGLSFGRIQCTSDLLPTDITGLSIFERKEERFRFVPGPIFNQVVLADEVNRAMPKTQSAMLEAMEERRVTVDGTTYGLPEPFLVIATQNPAEMVGTYPLPESQLDRFLIATGVGYPPPEIERAIIRGGSIREEIRQIRPLVTAEDILAARQAVRNVHLSEKVVDYIHRLATATRSHPQLLAGISTRGAIGMAAASRASAFLDGRDYVLPEDVQQTAVPVGAHRLILRPHYEVLSKEEVLQSILRNVPVPRF